MHRSTPQHAASLCFKTLLLSSALAGCGGASVTAWQPPTARDRHDDPNSVRPGHCNSGPLPVWSALTAPEQSALSNTEAARAGDAKALFALSLVASGDKRDAASYASFQARIDKFVTDVKPKVDAQTSEWHRGYELHRAMHRVFFRSEKGGLGNYQLSQSRVSQIFGTAHYNCISSAMLFTVLARSFDMPVRGVAVPTHAFVEMGAPGAKLLEVETTSQTGFDLVHDERFYREAAAEWSSSRGLAPVTIEQYKTRKILEPYQFMALGMTNQSGLEEGEPAFRLAEVSALVDPDNAEAQLRRMQFYIQEANALREAEAAHTSAKFLSCVAPAIDETAQKRPDDLEVQQYVSWARWYHADALSVTGQADKASATAEAGLDGLNPKVKDYAALRDNFLMTLQDRMLVLMQKNQFEEASGALGKHITHCRSSQVCTGNLEAVYSNWSADRQNEGDWHGARRALTSCTEQLPESQNCVAALKDLESRHRF